MVATPRWFISAALIAGLLALAMRGGDWAVSALSLVGADGANPLGDWRLWAALAVYMALMAIPFCPGIEVGLALLAMYGAKVAPAVYLATVTALLLAFAAGRLAPQRLLAAAFAALGLRRAHDLTQRIAALQPEQRVALLAQGPGVWRQALLRYRHVALALALNLPGNIVLGDGGGIALAAGLSRLYSFPAFALTVIIAVAPVPVALMVFGT